MRRWCLNTPRVGHTPRLAGYRKCIHLCNRAYTCVYIYTIQPGLTTTDSAWDDQAVGSGTQKVHCYWDSYKFIAYCLIIPINCHLYLGIFGDNIWVFRNIKYPPTQVWFHIWIVTPHIGTCTNWLLKKRFLSHPNTRERSASIRKRKPLLLQYLLGNLWNKLSTTSRTHKDIAW